MRSSPRFRAALGAFLSLVALTAQTPRVALASGGCGMEGCPLETRGPAGEGKRFSLDLAYQSIDQNQLWNGGGESSLAAISTTAHTTDLETRTRDWVGVGVARITDRIVVSAAIAYFDRLQRSEVQHHTGFFVPTEWSFRGLGDLGLTASVRPFASLATASNQLSLLGGIKLPTGRRHVDAVVPNGPFPTPAIEPAPGVRPGTGSVDGMAGVQFSHPLAGRTVHGDRESIPLTMGAVFRYSGRGTEDYRVGNEVQLSLDSGYPVFRSVRLIGQLSATSHGRDDPGSSGAAPHHSGGQSVLATPGLRIQWTPLLASYGYFQFRVYERSNGPQVVAPLQLMFGTTCELGW